MKTDDYIALLAKIKKARIAIDQHVLVDKNSKKEMYLALLSIRIATLVESVLCLYSAGLFSTIAILFRSVVEANLDIENLLEDDSYIKDLDYRYFNEWERLFDSSQRGNSFLTGLLSSKETSALVSLIKREYELLKASGYIGLTVKNRFDKLNQSSVYYSIYNISCCNSHNNLRALFDWNTVTNEDGTFSIVYFSHDKSKLKPFLDSITAIFVNSTIKMMKVFQVEVDSEFASLAQELEIIRESA